MLIPDIQETARLVRVATQRLKETSGEFHFMLVRYVKVFKQKEKFTIYQEGFSLFQHAVYVFAFFTSRK